MKKSLILLFILLLSAYSANAVVTQLTINSPINGTTYNADYFKVNNWRVGRIPIDLSLDEEADYLQISYDGVRYRTLCRRCDIYNVLPLFNNKL